MRIFANNILAGKISRFALAVLFATFAGKAIRGIYEHWEYLQDRAIFWQLFASGGQQNDILGLTHKLIWLSLMLSMWWKLWKFDVFFKPDSKEKTSGEDKDFEEPEHSQKVEEEKMEEETEEPEKTSDPLEEDFARVLGLAGAYDMNEVKSAYRTLIAQYHPDKVSRMGDEIREVAERKAKEINESYDFFRRKYDL